MRPSPAAAPTAPRTPEAARPASRAWPVGMWLAGMLATFYPMFLSGFRLVPGGLGDSRLVNFTLEHSWRWLTGLPLAADLFSPPIFYPVRHVAFYTDLMLGAAPLYWPWRLLGADPYTAYQLWSLTCWSLNFWAAYLLLRRLGVGRIGGSAGAYLFTFASARVANIMHGQLFPQFFLVLALLAVVELVRPGGGEDAPRRRLWLASTALWGALLLQLATAFYPLLFFVIAAAIATALGLALPDARTVLGRALRRAWLPLAVGAGVAALLAAPLVAGYWHAAGETGVRPYSLRMLPRPLSFVMPGRGSLLYGWVHNLPGLRWAGAPPHHNGFGMLTLAAAAAGLWIGRRRRDVQLAVLAVAALAFLTLRMPGDWSLWRWLRVAIPGAAALRALARVGALALYPAALGLALAAERVARRSRWLLVVMMLAVVAEQVHRPYCFDKVAAEQHTAAIAAAIPADAAAFLLVGEDPGPQDSLHDDAAWAALATGVPTVNGRYGNRPRFWQLRDLEVRKPGQRRRLRARFELWCRQRGLDPAAVAWVDADRIPPAH